MSWGWKWGWYGLVAVCSKGFCRHIVKHQPLIHEIEYVICRNTTNVTRNTTNIYMDVFLRRWLPRHNVNKTVNSCLPTTNCRTLSGILLRKLKVSPTSNTREFQLTGPWITQTTYSGTSLLRSPTGLGKSYLNGEVTLLQGVICTVEYNLGLSHGY